MKYSFEPGPRTAVPIIDSDALFPVRRIYCVGRNYTAHVREMGFDPAREAPFFFCKPTDAIVAVAPGECAEVSYPSGSANYQHEIELVAAVGRGGRDICAAHALAHVFGYAVGLDMTRRDLQIAARDGGRPWEVGKSFDRSAPIGWLHAAASVGHPAKGGIWVEVDGQVRQRSDLGNLIWSIPEIIANLSTLFELQPGDLIFSGTPDGVGKVTKGQVMRGGIDGLGELRVRVA